MLSLRSQLDKIIITAMDRFVWFVLLVVMSHLVTEFTRVTGYARGNRHDVVLVNDSLIQPKSVANMIFYPDEEYSFYEQQMSQYNNIYPSNNYNQNHNSNNNYNSNSNLNYASATNAETITTGFPFSFRPLIDSIFEIPISTLRAVNNLVARLTGSYQHQVTAGVNKYKNNNALPEKLQAFRSLLLPNGSINESTATSASIVLNSVATHENNAKSSNSDNNENKNNRNAEIRLRRSLLREVNA
ncbi:GATA zinc finger domain-containing protein 8 isoform X1 [Eurosta solidaginis]|uniref:GATA zinc finger domain-containing protein 8 isoform X1 n=2 Tax=Eurosta solidaginis TaxID=178769 RepID=UPI00353149BE